jgi:hypothetical protein
MSKLFIVLLFLVMIPLAFSDTPIDACATLNTAGERFYLTEDVSGTGDCMKIFQNNVILDLNGFSINGDGDSGDEGVVVYNGKTGIVVKDGTINNFGYGVYTTYTSSGITIDNVDFTNNNYDINFPAPVYITHDSTFTSEVRTWDTTINQSNFSALRAVFTGNLNLNQVTNFEVSDTLKVQSSHTATYPAGLQLKVGNICGSAFSGYTYTNNPEVYMVGNQQYTGSGDCLDVYQDGLTINLGGNTLSSTTGNGDAFDLTNSPAGIIIKNGTIDNFDTGISNMNHAPQLTIDDVSFTSNDVADVLIIDYGSGNAPKEVIITGNSTFGGKLRISGMDSAVINQPVLSAFEADFDYMNSVDFTNMDYMDLTDDLLIQGSSVTLNSDFKAYVGDLCGC